VALRLWDEAWRGPLLLLGKGAGMLPQKNFGSMFGGFFSSSEESESVTEPVPDSPMLTFNRLFFSYAYMGLLRLTLSGAVDSNDERWGELAVRMRENFEVAKNDDMARTAFIGVLGKKEATKMGLEAKEGELDDVLGEVRDLQVSKRVGRASLLHTFPSLTRAHGTDRSLLRRRRHNGGVRETLPPRTEFPRLDHGRQGSSLQRHISIVSAVQLYGRERSRAGAGLGAGGSRQQAERGELRATGVREHEARVRRRRG